MNRVHSKDLSNFSREESVCDRDNTTSGFLRLNRKPQSVNVPSDTLKLRDKLGANSILGTHVTACFLRRGKRGSGGCGRRTGAEKREGRAESERKRVGAQ